MLTNELYFVLPAVIMAFLIASAVIMAFLIASLLVPVLNSIADKISDVRNDLVKREKSGNRVAAGLGIVLAVSLSFQLWSVNDIHTFHPYFFASLALFFLSGYVTGKEITASLKRTGIQFSAAVILIAGVSSEVGSYAGLMGLGGYSEFVSILFLSGIITLITYLFKYMGRAPEMLGGIAIIITSVLGIWFWVAGFFSMALFSFIVSSSLIGYMMCSTNLKTVELGGFGWSGIGFVIAFLVMEFLLANGLVAGQGVHLANGSSLVLSLLIIPMVIWAADFISGDATEKINERSEYYLVNLYSRLGMDKNQTSFLFWMINLSIIGVAYSTMHLHLAMQATILISIGIFYTTAILKAVLFTKVLSRKVSKLESAWEKNWTRD